MKILLIGIDIYLEFSGGGQSITRKIIESLPEYSFYYFVDKEPLDNSQRPLNAFVFKIGNLIDVSVEGDKLSKMELNSLKFANRFARVVRNQVFDVVEYPDYSVFGQYLRIAFERHSVSVGKFILSLHGNISKSMEINDIKAPQIDLIKMEKLQFMDADLVYGISSRYIQENIFFNSRLVKYINPLNFLNSTLTNIPNLQSLPTLYFVGRFEHRKGPDIFLEIVSNLKKESYESIKMIGDDVLFKSGITYKTRIEKICKEYDLNVDISAPIPQTDLNNIYKGNAILILPVRYDSFNLVAMDALFSACPVAISSNAGFCDFVDSNFPNLPYIKIENPLDSISRIQNVIDNFAEYKCRLLDELKNVNEVNNLRSEFIDFYNLKVEKTSKLNTYFTYHEKWISLNIIVQNLLLNFFSKSVYLKIRNLKSLLIG